MIYLIGGAPRSGKSTLAQRLAAKLGIGWVSTDQLVQLLHAKEVVGVKTEWCADPDAIRASATWFFPCLERFIWSVTGSTQQYIIEGVDMLPTQVDQLAEVYTVRAVFIGCSKMTLEIFDQHPGHSKGYAILPEEMRRQIVHDVPLWSDFIRQEAAKFDYPYIDMCDDFSARLDKAEAALTD